MTEKCESLMDFEEKKLVFVKFLQDQKNRVEEMRRRGGFYDYLYGQYILDELDNVLLNYMKVYK